MKIVIFTLAAQRDKSVNNLIAEHLRKYGHEVYVHSYLGGAEQSIPYLKPEVVIHPFPGGDFKFESVKQCKKWGCVTMVRRGEAGASRKSFEAMEPDRQSIILGNWDYTPYTDLELTWGQEFTDLLIEKKGIPVEKVKACGAFAFDAYFLPENKRDENSVKTILFATGFDGADDTPTNSECGVPQGSPFHKVLYDEHTKARRLWIETIKELVKWFGEQWRFTLKVRPGEQNTKYLEVFGKTVDIYPQVTPSIDALKETDILVHSGSTMAIEAHLLGIPSFNFHNINPDPLLASVCPRLETYKELEWNLSQTNIHQSNINEAVYNELQEHLYGKIDGKACERAAGFIHEHIKDKKIETDIPDKWVRTPDYLDDGVHIERQEGDRKWFCPNCKNRFFSCPEKEFTRCPWCGVGIKKIYRGGSAYET